MNIRDYVDNDKVTKDLQSIYKYININRESINMQMMEIQVRIQSKYNTSTLEGTGARCLISVPIRYKQELTSEKITKYLTDIDSIIKESFKNINSDAIKHLVDVYVVGETVYINLK